MKKEELNFNISNILSNPEKQWSEFKRTIQGKSRLALRKLDVDWEKYNTNDYLFTHDTACCSVATQDNGYWIKRPCWELVNANGNAWTSPVLLASFKTFIGGDNFLEHQQLPALSKGKILDAVLRPVKHHSNKYDEDADIYYCDVLVATDRKHENLIQRIESGELNTLSMGCLCQVCQCSICGKKIYDGDKNCEHIDRHLGEMVTCSDGEKRMCAELCGALDDNGNYIEGSNTFIQLSFVQNPAFPGSVVNYFVQTDEQKRIRENSKDELAQLFEGNLFERLKVADTDSKIALNILKKYALQEKMKRISKNIFDKI